MQVAPAGLSKPATTNGVVRAVAEDGSVAPGLGVEPAQLLALWRDVSRVRRVSRRLVALQREGRISAHASPVGEEGALVGALSALEPSDWVFPTAREALVAILRGVSVEAYIHHAFGDARDPLEGRAPPDHLCSRAGNVAPPSGTLGAHLTHAVGCAWAMRSKREVALAFLDAAATTTGHFHNALNFAGVLSAPVVLVCRNDGRHSVDAAATDGLAGKAIGYGVSCAQVDGADVLAVRGVVAEAVARARAGKGPALIEALTSPPLDGTLDVSPERDPLAVLERAIGKAGGDPSREATADAIDQELAQAVAAASGVGRPPGDTIFSNVFKELPNHLRAQMGRS